MVRILAAVLITLAFGAATVKATTHIVNFGGSLGDSYEPESFKVSVGDTILWQGPFSKHPMTLMKAPKGAAGFSNINSGTSYRYVVTVPGSYEYQCDKHVDMGMTGSFTAVAAK